MSRSSVNDLSTVTSAAATPATSSTISPRPAMMSSLLTVVPFEGGGRSPDRRRLGFRGNSAASDRAQRTARRSTRQRVARRAGRLGPLADSGTSEHLAGIGQAGAERDGEHEFAGLHLTSGPHP